MSIERLKDLEIWKNAREVCKTVNLLAKEGTFSNNYKLKDQIQSLSGSIMDNIACPVN